MSRGSRAVDGTLTDQPLDVSVSTPELLGRGFRDFQRFRVTIPGEDGPSTETCDILRYGRVIAVLPLDAARDAVVVMRQFRLAAHLANGRGQMIEIVAGGVQQGESLVQAARRECVEEIGVAPQTLIELFTFLPTPGASDEEITLFLGLLDSSQVPERAGAAAENEATQPFAVSIDEALAALAGGTMHDGPLILALQWLALNRGRLDDIIRKGAAAP